MKISERGQITIPKKIRGKYGLETDVEVEFVELDGTIQLRKKSMIHPVDKVTGILNSPKDTDKYIEEIRGR